MFIRPEVSVKIIEVLSERLDLYGSRMAHIALKEVTPAWQASSSVSAGARRSHLERPARYPPATPTSSCMLVGARRVAVTRALGELWKAGALYSVCHKY
jgi:hypothetical protein